MVTKSSLDLLQEMTRKSSDCGCFILIFWRRHQHRLTLESRSRGRNCLSAHIQKTFSVVSLFHLFSRNRNRRNERCLEVVGAPNSFRAISTFKTKVLGNQNLISSFLGMSNLPRNYLYFCLHRARYEVRETIYNCSLSTKCCGIVLQQ